MGARNLGFTAMARFMAVERYCQAQEPFSTHTTRGPNPDRGHGHADRPVPGGPRPPARPPARG